ncbi:hypothetical protein GGX14DRAFT_698138, partial [Mycena pura]
MPTDRESIAPYSPMLKPALDRLPAFVVHVPTLVPDILSSLASTFDKDIESTSIKLDRLKRLCDLKAQQTAFVGLRDFDSTPIRTEGDVTIIAGVVIRLLREIARTAYGISVENVEQVTMVDQRPNRFLSRDRSRFSVWENKGWKAFERHAPNIVSLVKSDEGKALVFSGDEEHGRAMLYKIALAMFDESLFWGLLWGGHQFLVFQRVSSADPTRYGIICSDIHPVNDLFTVILGLLLVPGHEPLVDLAPFGIPVPTTCPSCDNQILTRRSRKQLDSLRSDLEGAEEDGVEEDSSAEEDDMEGSSL